MTILALCMSTYVYAEDNTSKLSTEITNKINGETKSIEALAKERQDTIAKITALKAEIGKLDTYVDVIDKETVKIKHNMDSNNKKLVELQNPTFEVLSAPNVALKENAGNKDANMMEKNKKADMVAVEEVKETKKQKKRAKKQVKAPSQKHSQDLANMINQISSGNIKKK